MIKRIKGNLGEKVEPNVITEEKFESSLKDEPQAFKREKTIQEPAVTIDSEGQVEPDDPSVVTNPDISISQPDVIPDTPAITEPDVIAEEIESSEDFFKQPQDSINPEYMDDYKLFRENENDREESEKTLAILQELESSKVDAEVDPNEISQQAKLEDQQQSARKRGFFKDVALGVIRAPSEIAGGVTEGVVEITNLTNKLLGLSKLVGEAKIPEFLKTDEKRKTVTGDLIRGISRLSIGFKGVDKILNAFKIGAAATATGKVAERIGKLSAADLLVFDEQENRLSNVIESVPALQNPITDFLKTDPEDSFAEAKLKQAIEGAALGAVGESLFAGIKAMRIVKPLKEKILTETELAFKETSEQEIFKKSFKNIGDIDNKELIFKTELTPEQIKAFGKRQPSPLDSLEINFARIEGPEDVKNVMQSLINEPSLKPAIDAARRGKRSNLQTLKSAEDISGFNELLSRRKGQSFNAEQTTAVRQVYYKTTTKLMETAERASLPDRTSIDVFNFRKMLATHKMVQGEVLGVRAETGRALQAWSIPVGEGRVDVKGLEDTLSNFGGANSSIELAKKIASHGSSLNTTQINALTQKGAFARTTDALIEAWRLGLVSNPAIHVTNILEGGLTALAEVPKRAIQSMFKDSGVGSTEPLYLMLGYVNSFKGAFLNSAKAFKTGRTGFSTGKLELPRQRATSREVLDASGIMKPFAYGLDYYGRAVEIAGKGLAAGDEFARAILSGGEKHALAARDATDRGLKGKEFRDHVAQLVANPTDEIIKTAREFAEYNIFVKRFEDLGQTAQTLLAKVPSLRLIFPFVKVAGNIFKYNYEHSPLAFTSSRIRQEIQAGGLKQSEALAKIGLGSAMISTASDLAFSGILTGQGPADPAKQRLLRASGWQPYSLRIGDKYHSLVRFGALGSLLMGSADLTEILSNYESYDMQAQDEVEEVTTALIAAVSNQVIGQTFMSGMSEMLQVLADPKRRGERYIQKFAGSVVPTAVGSLAKQFDNEAKEITSVLDSIKSRIPGLSKQVPARRNIWGEKISAYYPSFDGHLGVVGDTVEKIGNWFSPVYMSKEKDSPINRFMLENGFPVNMPSKRQNFDNSMVDLNEYPELYSRLVELRGTIELTKYNGLTMKEYMSDLVQGLDSRSSRLFMLDLDEQKNYLSNIVSDYAKAAKKELLDESPVLEQIIFENEFNERKQALELTAKSSQQKTFP